MKKYRLLRNNKETGPFTAAQLLDMGLKAYDLVWLDGRSAAWRYPCEMDEFKPYVPAVEEQPFDRFFKKPPNTGNPLKNTPIDTPPLQNRSAETPKTKPRIRVKADWNQVGQPTTQHTPHGITPETKFPLTNDAPKQAIANTSWENQWLNWQQEKKAVEDAARQDHSTFTINKVDAAPEMETKFAQSLDSLKQRYVDTVLKAKGQATTCWLKHRLTTTLVLLAVPVLGFGIWLGSTWHGDAEAIKPPVAVNNVTPAPVANTVQQVQAVDDNTAQLGIPGTTGNTTAVQKQPTETKEVIPDFDGDKATNLEHGKQYAELSKKTQRQTASQTLPAVGKHGGPLLKTKPLPSATKQNPAIARQQAYKFTPALPTTPGARNKTVNPALATASPNPTAKSASTSSAANQNWQRAAPQTAKLAEPTTPIFTHYKPLQKIDDFVTVEADQPLTNGAQNMALNVQNVSDARIDLVVIDVQYFDATGKLKNGQTMYVKNIPEDETVRVKIPDNNTASKIKYKVSLVSVEQKGVYLVAE